MIKHTHAINVSTVDTRLTQAEKERGEEAKKEVDTKQQDMVPTQPIEKETHMLGTRLP